MEQLISAATLSTTICILSGIFAVVILAITLAVFSNYVLYNDKGKKKIIKGMKKEKQACCLFLRPFFYLHFFLASISKLYVNATKKLQILSEKLLLKITLMRQILSLISAMAVTEVFLKTEWTTK